MACARGLLVNSTQRRALRLGRVLQLEGDELPTKTRSFFGGLHDWIGDDEPVVDDVADSSLVEFGVICMLGRQASGAALACLRP